MRIICTQMDKGGKPISKPEIWEGWHYPAVVSAVTHDITNFEVGAEHAPSAAYLVHLSDWLHSGDDIDIMYLTTPYGLDIWQYDAEESE